MPRVTNDQGQGPAARQRDLSPRERDRFDECVLPYLDAAYNLARYLLRDPDDAEDVVQEAFLRAIRHFAGFRGADGRAWLLSIVRNACFTELRRRRTGGQTVAFEEEMHSEAADQEGPETDLSRSFAVESVRDGLARLPVEFREVLVLRELEGLSYKEIAQVAAVPIGTVMSRLARGRRQLSLVLATGPEENA
jgi:RNA polymerase sigma-70 factor (ECF subfamily)